MTDGAKVQVLFHAVGIMADEPPTSLVVMWLGVLVCIVERLSGGAGSFSSSLRTARQSPSSRAQNPDR